MIHRISEWLDRGYNGVVFCLTLTLFIGAVKPVDAQDLYTTSGYLLPDMVDRGHFALVLSDGRYRAEAPAGCPELTTWQNVTVWLSDDASNWVVLTPSGADTPQCSAHVLAKMSDVGCLRASPTDNNPEPGCDVSLEIPDEE